VHGGVYTDTDTACVRPIDDWATNPEKRQDHPLLESLPYLWRIVEQGDKIPGNISDQIPGDDRPSLLVALEADAKHTGQDWRKDSLVRGLQIAQWTILAKKGHPVMLDVLGKALSTARDIREKEQRGEEVEVPDIVSQAYFHIYQADGRTARVVRTRRIVSILL